MSEFSQIPTPNQKHFGVPTISTFDLVTSAPMQISQNVRFFFPIPRESASNDYFINLKSDYTFSLDSGANLVSGTSYSNLFVPMAAQFIAQNNCYLKGVIGYIASPTTAECKDKIHISVWRKSVDIAGVSDTPIHLLFTQNFTFSGGEVHQILGGNSVKEKSLYINQGEGVIISIRLDSAKTCIRDCYGDLEMVFESIDNQATTDSFQFESNSTEMGGVIEKTISRRDVTYNISNNIIKSKPL